MAQHRGFMFRAGAREASSWLLLKLQRPRKLWMLRFRVNCLGGRGYEATDFGSVLRVYRASCSWHSFLMSVSLSTADASVQLAGRQKKLASKYAERTTSPLHTRTKS